MSASGFAIYIGVCLLAGGLLLRWLHRWLRQAEAARVTHLERLRRFDPIRTQSPVDHPVEDARERGLESLATRFSVIRRVLTPAVALCLALVLVLPLLNAVPATVVSLLVAVVGVVVGIAAKPALENLFAGIVVTLSQPFRIGDTVVVDGLYGTIENITLTHTVVKLWDWRRYMVPNHRVVEKEFLNHSIVDRYQWAHVEFWVAPEADLELVRSLAIAAARSSRSFADYEEPRFWVMELGREGIRCWIAAWANNPSSAWALMHDVRTKLAQDLRAAGISTHVHRHAWEGEQPALPAVNPTALPESHSASTTPQTVSTRHAGAMD